MCRAYHFRYSADVMRSRVKKNLIAVSDANMLKMLQKTLYNIGEPEYMVSFEDYKVSELPKCVPIRFSLHKDSTKIIQDPESGLCKISIVYSSREPIQLSVYFFAKEIIDAKKGSLYLSIEKSYADKSVTLKLPSGYNQEVIINTDLNLSNFPSDKLNFNDNITFPVVIFIKDSQDNSMLYYKIEDYKLIKIRESYSLCNKTYEVFDAYGNEDSACSICLELGQEKVLAIPCRHACVCSGCFKNLMNSNPKCPVCRSKIKTFFKIKR